MSIPVVKEHLDRISEALSAALLARDASTYNHSTRVITLSNRLGNACGLSSEELYYLEAGARFHDIGKIGIPDYILRKPSQLSHAEYDLMKQHPGIGAEMFRRINAPEMDNFAKVIEHHHERYDGTGYPSGLQGNEIPLLSRVIAIVDTYDAITSPRRYHSADPHDTAIATISRERGRQFDPDISGMFLEMIASD